MATRHSFMMGGAATAGVFAVAGSASAQRRSTGKSVTRQFTVNGCPGTVRIDVADGDAVIAQPSIDIRNPENKLGLIDIHAPCRKTR